MQVEAPAVAVYVQHLAAGVKSRRQSAFHGPGVKLPGAQAAGGDLGLVKAAGAGDGQGKVPHPAAERLLNEPVAGSTLPPPICFAYSPNSVFAMISSGVLLPLAMKVFVIRLVGAKR